MSDYNRAERERQEDIELLEKLRPIDDDFMRVIYRGQPALAQDTLRTITGVGDLVLVAEETQRDVRRLAGSRSVVLDVYGEDSEGRVYDLEVQRAGDGAEPRRARYNGSAMDVEALGAGGRFSELPERYVIFVTERDFFGRGAGAYRFDYADWRAGVALGDGSHVIYANGEYRGDDALGALMHDFACADPDEMLTGPLADRVRYLKRNEEGVVKMCEILDEMRSEAEARGLEQGLERGLRKGLERGRLQALFELVRDGALPLPAAAGRAGMTPEAFAARAERDGFA